MNWRTSLSLLPALVAGLAITTTEAHALALDWSGYFRATHEFVHDYMMNKAQPGYANSGAGGEYIPGEGDPNATFSTMFMKLKPKVLVNDNIIVHSEWDLGDARNGFFGRNIPTYDRNNQFSTSKGNLELSVARLWLDVHSDFGTIQVGRAPMHWGLGVIFNAGDNPFDRYQSTSDTIRLISKFGYISLMPLYAKNAMGKSLTGARNPITNTATEGSDDVTDYGIGLSYDNPEEDLNAGFLFYKRNASDQQNSYYLPSTATQYSTGANGMNLKLFDFYAKKSWRHFELGAEIPLYTGQVGDVNGAGERNEYRAVALAAEAALKYDTWKHALKFGTTPGQGSIDATGARDKNFSALQFHRAYKLGQILFNYNLSNFGPANPDAVPVTNTGTSASSFNPSYVSPYDTGITNAKYLMLSSQKNWEQWGLNFGLVWAQANQTAQAGKLAYNHRTRQWFNSVATQSKNMGIEVDFGTRYNWDDNISFGIDAGMLFPGDYFKYINRATEQGPANTVSAISFSAATVF